MMRRGLLFDGKNMPTRPPLHRPAGQAPSGAHDRERPSASARGYYRLWYKFRTQILAARPLCEDCLAAGRVAPATEPHHIPMLDPGAGKTKTARLWTSYGLSRGKCAIWCGPQNSNDPTSAAG